MKKYIKIAIATFAGAVLVSSCDLDLVPNSAIAYQEDDVLIQTQANLDALENGILSSFRARQNGGYVESVEFQFDGFNATVDYGNNYGALHKSDYNFTSSDYDVEDLWADNYTSIKNYNIFIAAAEDVDESLADATAVVKGEAHFFRAWSYLQLARAFGKQYSSGASSDPCVPLVLVYDQAEQPARATVAEVYAQIKADLDIAASLLSEKKGAVRSKKPTIDAVNALYARYYLDIADYANAAAYAHKVIDTKTYALASTAEEMTDEYVNDLGTEPIMQLAISLTEFTGNTLNLWTNAVTDQTYKEVFRPYFIPTQTVVDSYEDGDIRFEAWFDGKTPVFVSGSYFNTKDTDFYTFSKFRGNPALVSTSIRNGRNAPKPFKIGEMYLIAAEAELAVGNVAAAKTDLNVLQSARGASETEATTATVQLEWMRETIGEGLRKSCLKRWGIGFNGRPMQPGAANILLQGDAFDGKVFTADNYLFQWPVPAHEMKINKNLVQNPGYDAL